MWPVDASFRQLLPGLMWIIEWFGALLAIAGALIMSMNLRWSWYAWPVWILSNVVLIIPMIGGEHWGMVTMQIAFLAVNLNGLLRHWRIPPTPLRGPTVMLHYAAAHRQTGDCFGKPSQIRSRVEVAPCLTATKVRGSTASQTAHRSTNLLLARYAQYGLARDFATSEVIVRASAAPSSTESIPRVRSHVQ